MVNLEMTPSRPAALPKYSRMTRMRSKYWKPLAEMLRSFTWLCRAA